MSQYRYDHTRQNLTSSDLVFQHFEKKKNMGRRIENNENENEFCITPQSPLTQNIFFRGLIFLVSVFWHFVCRFSCSGFEALFSSKPEQPNFCVCMFFFSFPWLYRCEGAATKYKKRTTRNL